MVAVVCWTGVRERDEWGHKGTCHTIRRAPGLTETLRTWHLYQLGTKCRWYQTVSALYLIRRHDCFGSVRAVLNLSQLHSGVGQEFGTGSQLVTSYLILTIIATYYTSTVDDGMSTDIPEFLFSHHCKKPFLKKNKVMSCAIFVSAFAWNFRLHTSV